MRRRVWFLLVAIIIGLSVRAQAAEVFAQGFHGTENLAVDGQGHVYVSDTDQLWRVDREGKTQALYTRGPAEDGISLGGVSLGPGGKVYFSTGNRIQVLDPAGDKVEVLVQGLDFANGIAFNDAGDLFIADSNTRKLYVVPAGSRELKVLVDQPGWINGLAYSRGDDTLYFTISSPGRVGGFRLGPGPSVKEEITVAKFPLGGLDDLALDGDGNLYVCMWLNGKVMKVTPGGDKTVFMDKLDGPSAVELGVGPDAGKLFICIKGGTPAFKGAEVMAVEVQARPYRMPFQPGE